MLTDGHILVGCKRGVCDRVDQWFWRREVKLESGIARVVCSEWCAREASVEYGADFHIPDHISPSPLRLLPHAADGFNSMGNVNIDIDGFIKIQRSLQARAREQG